MSEPDKVACLILLAAVIAFSVVNNLIWLRTDTRPPRWDEASYLTASLNYYGCLISGGVVAFTRCFLTLSPSRPHLVPALAVPSYLLLGISTDSALRVNPLAFVLLILAVYGTGARLASPWSGLLAALLVSTYPGIFGFSRVFLLEFVHATLVASSLYLLLGTESFSHRGASLAFGALVGLGLLCRIFFPIFIIGPLGVCTYLAWKRSRQSTSGPMPVRFQWWANGGLALVVSVTVAAPWYMINFIPVIQRSLSAAYGAEAVGYGPSNPLTLHAILSYLIIFTNLHTTPLGMVIFLGAAAILWAKRSSLPSEALMGKLGLSYGLFFLLSAVLIPLMIFATGRAQDPKNIAPVLPVIAVVSAWGLLALKPSLLKKALIGFAIVVSLFQFWIGTYGVQAIPQEVGLSVGWNLPTLLIYRQASAMPLEPFDSLPKRENWSAPDILSRITGGSMESTRVPIMARPAVLGVIPNHPMFNMSNFTYFAALKGLPARVEQIGDWSGKGGDFRTELLDVDFAVMKTGDPGPAWINPYNAAMVEFLRSPESRLVEIPPRFPLPDGSQAILYAASGAPVMNGIPRMQFLRRVSFDDGLELLGYDLEEKGLTSRGRAFLVTYYWRALKEVGVDYQVFVHVTEGVGPRVITRWEHAPARGRYPISFWPVGLVIRDRGLYFLPGNAKEGLYLMRIGLYLPATGGRLRILHAAPGIIVDDGKARAGIGPINIK